jgi:type IV secretion system protein VirD4
LIRLILNQIGRRLTEELETKGKRQRLLLMLDEFPALGRLDFFESALAFMAGYGIKGFLIAQSLNQIEKAYGPNNAILDNCHVRVSFATNDERTAKRVSDALGTATEMRAMKNYAGHRLSPWLGHLMVSRSETARQLLTPGEIMQLPPDDEIVMAAGSPPIRAQKARYYQDRRFTERRLPPPVLTPLDPERRPADDWTGLALIAAPPPVETVGGKGEAGKETATGNGAGKGEGTGGASAPAEAGSASAKDDDPANAGLRREPGLPAHEDIVPQQPVVPAREFTFDEDGAADDAARNHRLQERMTGTACNASLDPKDGIAL